MCIRLLRDQAPMRPAQSLSGSALLTVSFVPIGTGVALTFSGATNTDPLRRQARVSNPEDQKPALREGVKRPQCR